jgi:hemerythrin-like domain-containing protein
MTPTETLKHEHKIILMVLDAAEREANSIKETGKVDADKLEKFVDFIRNFADRCHHAKEEGQLFVKMQERGMPKEGGPIAVMLMEHDEGRRHIKAVADAIEPATHGDTRAIFTINEHLQAYVNLLRMHIHKEDDILYPMADRFLTADDQRLLSEAFEKIEAQEIGEGVHEKYHRLAHDLAHA